MKTENEGRDCQWEKFARRVSVRGAEMMIYRCIRCHGFVEVLDQADPHQRDCPIPGIGQTWVILVDNKEVTGVVTGRLERGHGGAYVMATTAKVDGREITTHHLCQYFTGHPGYWRNSKPATRIRSQPVGSDALRSIIGRLVSSDSGTIPQARAAMGPDRQPPIEWDGTVYYFDPKQDRGSVEYQEWKAGIVKCIENMTSGTGILAVELVAMLVKVGAL